MLLKMLLGEMSIRSFPFFTTGHTSRVIPHLVPKLPLGGTLMPPSLPISIFPLVFSTQGSGVLDLVSGLSYNIMVITHLSGFLKRIKGSHS